MSEENRRAAQQLLPVETDQSSGVDDFERTIGTVSIGALELKAGQTVAGRYTVIEEIGRGGMGVGLQGQPVCTVQVFSTENH